VTIVEYLRVAESMRRRTVKPFFSLETSKESFV